MSEHFLVAHPELVDFHHKVEDFAVEVNSLIAERFKDRHPNPLSGGAFYSISANMLALHRAVLTLCFGGWAFSVPILLRTMFELYLQILVIGKNKKDAEYMAFLCNYWFLKHNINDPTFSNEAKQQFRKQIEDGLNRLDEETRKKAKHFIFKERMRRFWYSPEYSGPTDVLEKFGRSDLQFIYTHYSSASHGGLLGLNMLKDQPDSIHPNPRADKRSQNMALVSSSRLTLEASFARAQLESCNVSDAYQALLSELLGLKKAVDGGENLISVR